MHAITRTVKLAAVAVAFCAIATAIVVSRLYSYDSRQSVLDVQDNRTVLHAGDFSAITFLYQKTNRGKYVTYPNDITRICEFVNELNAVPISRDDSVYQSLKSSAGGQRLLMIFHKISGTIYSISFDISGSDDTFPIYFITSDSFHLYRATGVSGDEFFSVYFNLDYEEYRWISVEQRFDMPDN